MLVKVVPLLSRCLVLVPVLGLLSPACLVRATLPAERQPRLRNLPAAVPLSGVLAVGETNALALVQCVGPMQQAWRQQLEGMGVRLLRYVPDDTFVARFLGVRPAEVGQLPFVRALGVYGPSLKFDARLARPRVGRVRVLLTSDADGRQQVALRRSFSGIVRVAPLRQGAILEGDLKPGAMAGLLASEHVLWVEPAPRMRLFDEIASKYVGGDDGLAGTHTSTQQLGFDGTGVTVAVADSGLNNGDAETMHPDLWGRVTAFLHYGQLLDAADEHSHGTHVAGIVAGDASTGEVDENGYLYGLGVASGANLLAQRIFDGLGNYEAPPSFERLTRDAVRAGAVIGSNSWGDDTQGRYDLSAAEFDSLVRDADAQTAGDQPYILEFSAGNAGPASQTIGSPAVAKNVIATGASQNSREEFVIYGEGPEVMADFSSRGPCEDGRLKPDVVAPGTWIASLKSESATDENAWGSISDRYLYQGGTSQAGPHVSGAAAVFVQYYRELHAGLTPSPALVKAALIDAAVDMDNTMDTDPVPNSDEGWGRVDLTRVIGADRRFEYLDQSHPLGAGQGFEHRVVVASEGEPLRVTMVYTDAPGFPAALPALVNDLDLEVEAPDGAVYRGNQLVEGESFPNPAGWDRVNNVECVRLEVPAVGEYVVRVRAFNVVEDVRMDTPALDQDFALVISGGLPIPGQGVLFFDRAAYSAPSTIRVKLVDPDLAGQAAVTVRVTSTTEILGESLELRALGGAGVFANALALELGVAGSDGRLQIGHGDIVQGLYADAQPAGDRLAQARADLVAPIITDVKATNALGRVLVSWVTDEPATSSVWFGEGTWPTNRAGSGLLSTAHAVALDGLVPGTTNVFLVGSVDEAGNGSTNDNGGAFFRVVVAPTKTLLFVDAYLPADPLLGLNDVPRSEYTDALDQTGVSYEVWDVLERGTPGTNDLKPFRAVLWRLNEDPLADQPLEPADQSVLQAYVQGGGGLLMGSMEVLTLLSGSAFVTNVLQVQSFQEDAAIPSIEGEPDEPLTAGMLMDLSYEIYNSALLEFLMIEPDVADTLVPTTNAVPFLLSAATGDVAGLRSPKAPTDGSGRVVFLGFPLDVVPMTGDPPNNRASLLRSCLAFLAPGADGIGTVSLDAPAYSLPAVVTVEVGDSDLAGSGSLEAVALTDSATNGISVTLTESGRRGIFRGRFMLVSSGGTEPGDLLGRDGDLLRVVYQDASAGGVVQAIARVDTVSPSVTAVGVEPDYESAVVRWETSESTDALVQFSESAFLDNERTVYEGAMGDLHELTLTGLRPDQVYYFKITSRDAAGNATAVTNATGLFSFRTLKPLSAPWADDLERGGTNWVVFTGEDSVVSWQLGPPANGAETEAHSPMNAWGSNLGGEGVDLAESFLISPAVALTGGNVATLRFWHSYDFTSRSELDLLEGGEILLFTNNVSQPVVLAAWTDDLSGGWVEEEIDLTPYLGRVVYVVWHYVCLSFEAMPRPGWLVDDVAVEVSNAPRGTLIIANNLAQATFTVDGPFGYTGSGLGVTLTNIPLGEYAVVFGDVPYYMTPPPQTNQVGTTEPARVSGLYTFYDANQNGMSDAWEQQWFGEVSPDRTPATDSDADGATDFAEFQAGTIATNMYSKLEASSPVVLGEELRVQCPAVPGRAYRWEASVDFVDWVPATDWVRAQSTRLVMLLPLPADRALQWYRVAVRP